MFGTLIESGSHAKDFKRRGSFFFFTLGGYLALLLIAGVGSIYAYDAHLDRENLEVVSMFEPPVTPAEATMQNPQPRALAASTVVPKQTSPAVVTRAMNTVSETGIPETVSVVANPTGTRTSNVPLPVGINKNTDDGTLVGPALSNNIISDEDGTGGLSNGVARVAPPKPPTPRQPEAVIRKPIISGGVMNGVALSKPEPVYPSPARVARVEGAVTVQILVDEKGNVIQAQAVSGHPLLRQAAVQAARRVRFTPTLLSKEPVKVQGVITYNFKLS